MFSGGSRGAASFRGRRGSYGGRGGGRGGGGFRGGAGGSAQAQLGPPQEIVEVGEYLHECEKEIVCKFDKIDQLKVPYFNGRVFLSNKTEVGRIDEILGPINQMYVSVKLAEGVKASGIPFGTKMFIDTQQMLPLQRFLPAPAPASIVPKSRSPGGVKKFGAKASGSSFRGAGAGGQYSQGRRGNNFRGGGGRQQPNSSGGGRQQY